MKQVKTHYDNWLKTLEGDNVSNDLDQEIDIDNINNQEDLENLSLEDLEKLKLQLTQ